MSEQTQALVNQLKARVEELTQALADTENQLHQRANQLEAGTRISQLASSVLDSNTLCRRFARIVKVLFQLYHVGIYLTDESGQWAALYEAAGKASQKLKKEGRQLPLSGESVVAWVSKHQEVYLVGNTQCHRQMPVKVDDLLLPKAHSELTLPLLTNKRLIGVVDVQCVREHAFDNDTIATLQSLTDQVAPAIERAQLYALIDKLLAQPSEGT